MPRRTWLLGLSLASLAAAVPQEAQAQIFIQPPHVHVRPWWRPRIVVMPPPPPVYVQPQPPPVYYTAPQPPPVYAQPPCAPCQAAPPPVAQPVAPLPPPPVYVQPAPPPPVYVQPQPPPIYVQPPAPPVYVQRPMLPPPVALPPPRLAERPAWRQRVGIGARFAGLLNTDQLERSSQLGFGGELDFRVARHLALEVAGEYQRTVSDGLQRFNVPLTFGMRIHIGAPDWVVSPYFVIASGITYANLDLLHARDTAWFVEGQVGGGLEIRLGHRVGLNADVRGVGRVRMTDVADAVAATTFVNGKPFHPLGNEVGVQFRLGAAVYF